jgi:alpha-L-rhamnosidase
MNSFNHYSLGSCGEYLFGGIGGIRPASPGYKTIVIKPTIRPGLTWANTSYNSIEGLIATEWKQTAQRLTLKVVIPPNTTAAVSVPAKDIGSITESGKPVAQAQDVKFLRQTGNVFEFEIGSGTYRFASSVDE